MAEEPTVQIVSDFARYMLCDTTQLGAEDLSELMLLGDALRRSVEARRHQLTAYFDQEAMWQADGATSAANWLAARTGRRRCVVQRQVRLARGLAAAPAVAAVASQLSSEQLELLVSCRSQRTLEAYERDEHTLIDAALALSAEEFAELVRTWRRLADADGSTATQHVSVRLVHKPLQSAPPGRRLLRGRKRTDSRRR